MENFQKIDAYLDQHLDTSIAELSRLSAQPSVAAQNWGMAECAELVAKLLKERDFQVEILPTAGAPVVFAERKGHSQKTLLFYNHFDVQPAEPLELWDSPPFEPTIRQGKLYARGVSDDKGHITSRCSRSMLYWMQMGSYPVISNSSSKAKTSGEVPVA